MTKYTITNDGEERLLHLGDMIAKRINPNNVRRIEVRVLRDLQNEQYMLAKLSSNPPMTREDIIFGGQETAMLSAFNELLQRSWIEQM